MLHQARKAFPGTNALAYLASFVSEKEKEMFYSLIFVIIGRVYSSREPFKCSPLGYPPGFNPKC
jgi:hypothetical protein